MNSLLNACRQYLVTLQMACMPYHFLFWYVTQTAEECYESSRGLIAQFLYEKTPQWVESVFLAVSAVTLRKSEGAVNHAGSSMFQSTTTVSFYSLLFHSELWGRKKSLLKSLRFKCWCLFESGGPKRGSTERQRSSKFTKEPQPNLCPTSEL